MADGGARRGPKDLTTGPINRTLLLFALPTLGSSILQSLNGSINAMWIGQFLGESALAATTNANLVMFLMFSAVFGFGMAATILIGQSMGRRDIDAVRRVIGTTMGLFVLVSALVAIVGWIFAPDLLRLLATPENVYPLALAYLRVIFLGIPPMMINVLVTMCLRGTGDSMTPLWSMAAAVVVDVVLNPVFILGLGPFPAMGIAGSALATLIANLVALGCVLFYVYAKDLPVRLRGAEFGYLWPQATLLREILAKGTVMGLQMLVMSTSALVMVGLVNREGSTIIAAYGAASQLWTYIQMPAMSVGAAVSAMAAQNIGAGRWDRVGKVTQGGIMLNLVLTGVLIVAVTLADKHVLWLFLGTDTATIAIARHINLLIAWSFALFGISMVLSATVRANGAVIAPLIILFVAALPVRIGLALVSRPALGVDGIWWSFCAGSVVSLVLSTAYYRWGGWRRIRMVVPPSRIEVEEEALACAEPAGKAQPIG